MIVWALVSRQCRETVELYVDQCRAVRELDDALRDEPGWFGDLSVIKLDFGTLEHPRSMN